MRNQTSNSDVMAKAPADFDATFARLRGILEPHAKDLVVVHDTGENYYLDTEHIMPNRQPLYFGGVRRGKAYVSFYLMPVYLHPELLDDLSPALRKRMQGKSCFNFTTLDDEQAAELDRLTRTGIEAYRRDGYLAQEA